MTSQTLRKLLHNGDGGSNGIGDGGGGCLGDGGTDSIGGDGGSSNATPTTGGVDGGTQV